MEITISNFSDVKNVFFEDEKLGYLDEVRNYNNEMIIVIKKFKTLKELEKDYVKVTDIVAGYIQDKLTKKSFSDNLKWNIYLIFIVEKETINMEDSNLTDKIEKDKYCCKKYVLSVKDMGLLNQEIENHLPIFINLDRENSEDKSSEKGEIKPKKIEIPRAIEDYLTEKSLCLEELLKLKFDMNLIKEIYKGEENEN